MLVTFPARVSFPNFHEPDSVAGGDPKYGGKFIVEPSNTALVQKLDAAIEQVAKDKWGEKATNIVANFVKTGKKPDVFFVKEPYKSKDGEVYNGFEGMFYVSASNDKQPVLLSPSKSPVKPSDDMLYAGAYCVVQIDVWAQDNTFGRAVRATLKVVQHARDGERLGGGAAPDLDAFQEIQSEDPASFV